MLVIGWTDGAVGEFERLSRLAQANRKLVQDLADNSGAGFLTRVVAAATLQMRDLVSGAAPVDTGTLRSAHRGDVEPYNLGVMGIIDVDPDVRNPVSRSAPAVYGEIWADRYFNWFERTADAHGETVLDGMEQKLIERVEDLWR